MQLDNPILSLRVAKFNDEPVAEPINIEFGPAGGTIGRATDCTLVLPDQQRAISRVHARIEFRGEDYLLCDLGSNPSVLNDRALGGTREARLSDGDRLVIGAYLLEVTLAERTALRQSVTGGHDPLASAKVLGGPPMPDAGGDLLRLGDLDPLGQPGFGGPSHDARRVGFSGSESDHVSPELQAFSSPVPAARPAASGPSPLPPSSSGGGIPADYDPLADVLAQWEAPENAPVASPAYAPAAPAPRHTPHEMNAPFTARLPDAQSLPLPSHAGPTGLPSSLLDGPDAGAGSTPFDDLFAPAPASPAVPASAAPLTDLLPAEDFTPAPAPASVPQFAPAEAAASPAPAVSSPKPVAERAPAASYNPVTEPRPTPAVAREPEPIPSPRIPAASREATPPRAAPPSSHATPGSSSETIAALMDGLGLDPSRAPNLPDAELARLVGAMLRESLRGTMAVLRSRSMTKREARLDTTLIVARDNNPLKFFPDVDSCLAQMLTGRATGYLPPAEALERAFNDIESHGLAVIAGMRAALAQVLSRFDPAAIEAQLKEGGVFEKVLSNRKAKMWDLFVELQGAVAREADDDFQRLFGEAFNEAYEAQIDALRAAHERDRKARANQN